MNKFLLFLLLMTVTFNAYGKDDEDKDKTVKIGNFSLPASQQPGPLVSFGDNIIEKDQLQTYLFADEYKGRNKYSIDFFPGILCGLSDDLSVFFNIPFTPRYKDGPNHSQGVEDMFVQFEYALYNKEEKYAVDQATVVASVGFPTGSSTKVPPTGFGTPSLLLGVTYNTMTPDWFCFTCYGAVISWSKNRTKIGNQFLYELGFGRNIATFPGWILAWIVEFDGLLAERNKIHGSTDRNSGGNVIFATPSLWISSERLIFQLGAGYAIYQHLFGKQNKYIYSIDFNIGLTF